MVFSRQLLAATRGMPPGCGENGESNGPATHHQCLFGWWVGLWVVIAVSAVCPRRTISPKLLQPQVTKLKYDFPEYVVDSTDGLPVTGPNGQRVRPSAPGGTSQEHMQRTDNGPPATPTTRVIRHDEL